jgi:hypothetical protein
MFRTSDLEKFDPASFSEIARILLVRPIVPMFVYAKAAASDAVAFRIIESLRRRVIRQGGFAQVVIGVRDIRKMGYSEVRKSKPTESIATPSSDIKMLFGQASLNGAIFRLR